MDISKITKFLKQDDDDASDKIEEPKLPDTARDLYGDASEEGGKEKEVKEEKPAKSEGPPEELPDMSFPTSKEEKTSSPSTPEKEEHKIVSHESAEMPEMKEEIADFEKAIKEMYPNGYLERDSDGEKKGIDISDHGFFSEFQKFLEGNQLSKMAPELLDKDLLGKMKEFYIHKQEGKPHYFHTDELEEAVRNRMLELRNLERDWLAHKQRLAKEEELLISKEEEISDKTDELKYLLGQLRKREEMKKKAPEEKHFYLANGHKLKSVADLRASLRVMDEDVFRHHVNKERNDFAEWVSSVFGAHKLAVALAKCNSREEMLKLLTKADEN